MQLHLFALKQVVQLVSFILYPLFLSQDCYFSLIILNIFIKNCNFVMFHIKF